jgi:hypothetical protein
VNTGIFSDSLQKHPKKREYFITEKSVPAWYFLKVFFALIRCSGHEYTTLPGISHSFKNAALQQTLCSAV